MEILNQLSSQKLFFAANLNIFCPSNVDFDLLLSVPYLKKISAKIQLFYEIQFDKIIFFTNLFSINMFFYLNIFRQLCIFRLLTIQGFIIGSLVFNSLYSHLRKSLFPLFLNRSPHNPLGKCSIILCPLLSFLFSTFHLSS